MTLATAYHLIDNGDGWLLSLKQNWIPDALRRDRRPLLIVPGYGMNSFIFGWHPNGPSMNEFLARRGFEVWSVDLRAQGRAVCKGGRTDYRFSDVALTDLEVTFKGVLEHTYTDCDRIDAIGCSLGGTYLYIHAALRPAHPLGALVGMGAPLRWDKANALARALFHSPCLVSRIPIRGTRQVARAVLPLIVRFPWLVHIYMHPEMIDTRHLDTLAQAVEDPNPLLNEDMAWWFKRRDILMEDRWISEALKDVSVPFLCMYGNGDGIVPDDAALSAYRCIGTPAARKDTFIVGSSTLKFAHADMFISNPAAEMVFDPLAQWLEGLYR